MTTWVRRRKNLFKELRGLSFLRKQESRSYSLVLIDSKGISVIFLIIAMLLMVIIGYIFSYLIPTKQKSVVFPIQSTQAFFLAQSGVEFAVRYAKDQGWTTTTLLNNFNIAPNNTRGLGAGRFTLTYTNVAPNLDTLTSVGEVPIGTVRRSVRISNFTTFLSYFAYRRPITVQANQVTGGPLINFPMLVSVTNANLATVANGGNVASYNAVTGDPQDLIFEGLDDTTCGGVAGSSPCRLSHEIELYNPATGQLIAWVRVPSITNGTVIYMYYGNGCSVSTQDPGGVWANYRGVWHSDEAVTPLTDSTGNNNLTTNSTQVAGQIGNAQSYNGTTQLASKTAGVVNIPASNLSQTISVWFTIGAADNGTRSGVSFVNGTNAGLQFGQRNSTVCFWQWGGGVLGGTQANPAVNTWHYMVYTFDGTTIRPYYDGTALGTANTTPVAGTPSQIYFSTWNGTGEPWNGRIDEVRISNSGIVRSAGWIATEYRNQNAPGAFSTLGAQQNN
jgi:hypothetical protein